MYELKEEIERLEASIALLNSLIGVNERSDVTFISHRNWDTRTLVGLKQQYVKARRP
jgi:hypothetical protein